MSFYEDARTEVATVPGGWASESGEKANESPNRKVGVLSLRPTGNWHRLPAIPQPEGWDALTSAYRKLAPAPRNPPTGRLVIVHSSRTSGRTPDRRQGTEPV